MLRPGRFAGPAPARTFTSKLSSPTVTSKRCWIYYAGIQSIPAAGLTPARYAALWAASGERRGNRKKVLSSQFSVKAGVSLLTLSLAPCSNSHPTTTRGEMKGEAG